MLNISNYKVEEAILNHGPSSFSKVTDPKGARVLVYWLIFVFIIAFIILLLPWTQNIRSKGNITTLRPEQRPQTIHSAIPGKISNWFVKEGQFVQKGDTIITISEINSDFLDPNLIFRLKGLIKNKIDAVLSYENKVVAIENQIKALTEANKYKYSQAKNKYKQSLLKLQSDSAAYYSAKIDYDIALKQYDRLKSLYELGLKSLTDLENKRQKLQSTNAKVISAENKLLISTNDLTNASLELSFIKAEFDDKISSASSDKYTAETMLFKTKSEIFKSRVELSNYRGRNSNYVILAPQDCYITKVQVPGIGEIIKEGQPIVSVMPADYKLAVELYISPMDYPLIHKGERVRLLFDGWPVVVFSGWPNASYGTYGGEIIGIDQDISKNGKYRILVAHEENEPPWPEALRVGSGVNGMTLLNDVPIWYELWRNISGFPPEYYTAINEDDEYRKSDEYKKADKK